MILTTRIRLLIFAVLLPLILRPGTAVADYFWSISGVGSQSVYRVDAASGSATLMWTLPGVYNYAALTFGNGYLWGISGVGGQSVYRVDPSNGSATFLWNLPGSYNYRALAFGNGYLWGISGVGGQSVYRVDPSNGSATFMWNLPGSYNYRALAFGNGYLWGVSGVGGQSVYRVDPSNGSGTLMWNLPGSYNYRALAFGNGYLWGVSGVGGQSVYRVVPSNGSGTLMWNLPGSYSYTGLAFQDTTPPTGSISINGGAIYSTNVPVTLTLAATDAGSGVSEMRFSNDGSSWSSWLAYSTSASWSLAAGDGQKNVYAQFMDGTGNVSSFYVAAITLDTTPPVGSISVNGGDIYSTNVSVTLTLAATDTGSEVSEMRFSNDGSSWSSWLAYGTGAGWSLAAGNGPKTVYAQFMDGAANVSSDVYALILLGSAPFVTAQLTNLAVVAGGSASFSVSASGSGPFTYRWQFEGTNIPNNIITAVAGNGTNGFSGDGGAATNAILNAPAGVAVDLSGNLFISDSGNNRIREVGTNGIITTVAGNGTSGYSGDGGAATNANLNGPAGVAVDASGNLFIADTGNNVIRKAGMNGIITTVAGNGTNGYAGDGGAATNANLSGPSGLGIDSLENLFIADTSNGRIRKVGTTGIITTVAGNGANGYSGDGGAATNANLNEPAGVAVDSSGNLFIADTGNNRIREVGASGIITTVAGSGTTSYSGDGGAATNAGLILPFGVASDSAGNLFISESGRLKIRFGISLFTELFVREAGTNGNIMTVVPANDQNPVLVDGKGPDGLATDGVGNLFIADQVNGVVKEVGSSPTLTLPKAGLQNAGNYDVVVTSPFGSVTSSVVTLTVALPILHARIAGGPNIQFQLSGTAGSNYVLQYATNLMPPTTWLSFFTNAADSNGNWIFTNTNVSAFPRRYFRIVVP